MRLAAPLARLQTPADVILVTHRAAVDDRVTASSLGDHDFKGLIRPVPLYQIDAVR